MRSQRYLLAPVLAMMAGLTAPMAMAENRIDTQLPNAPDMAAYGDMAVGVRQIDLVNPDQINILAIDPKAPKPETMPRYDRPLVVEIWYPAADGATGDTALKTFIRDGKTEVTLQGKAMRDAVGNYFAWLSGQPVFAVASGRKYRLQGVCRGLDRPYRFNLPHQGCVWVDPSKPIAGSTVRAERNGADVFRGWIVSQRVGQHG